MRTELNLDEEKTTEYLLKDYAASGFTGKATFMISEENKISKTPTRRSESRQKRHKTN